MPQILEAQIWCRYTSIKIQEKAFDLNVLYEIWLTEGRNQKEQREICHFARAHICKICKIAASNWGYINVNVTKNAIAWGPSTKLMFSFTLVRKVTAPD